jgi:hypothetical protein
MTVRFLVSGAVPSVISHLLPGSGAGNVQRGTLAAILIFRRVGLLTPPEQRPRVRVRRPGCRPAVWNQAYGGAS